MVEGWQIIIITLVLFLFLGVAKDFVFPPRYKDREDTRKVRSYFTRKMKLQDLAAQIKNKVRAKREEKVNKKKKSSFKI